MFEIGTSLVLLGVGAITGFIAGLFGVGGGLIIVPATLWALQPYSGEHAQHLAIGTSFAVMVFTTFSSMRSQAKKGAVDWAVFRAMAPGMVSGVIVGSMLARLIPGHGLQIFFVIFALTLAVRTLLDIQPKPSRQLPKTVPIFCIGLLIGIFSSWIGIGGGGMCVPFFILCNVPMRRAVATSSALCWPVACAGLLGYLLSGWGVGGLPHGALSFVYWPAAVALAIGTMLFAPIGVRFAHQLPEKKLKKCFGVFLLVIACRMMYEMWS